MNICRILQLREDFYKDRTLGRVFINGVFFCHCLEDAVRSVKIPGVTAIPEWIYNVTLTMSTRFKRVMPLLHDVEGFSGVRIHGGNKPEDTEGCPLYGYYKTGDQIYGSAEKELTEIIKQYDKTYLSIQTREQS